jgi:hypothetical protein
VLLTITTTRAPATDLGYLPHKHPDRLQSFAVSAGEAHVFYPEATPERCTAALLLEVDPVALVRGNKNKNSDAELIRYVNDRPYAASSLLVCRSPAAPAASASGAAESSFGEPGSGVSGMIWTRTGRPFFSAQLTAALADQVRAAAEKAGLFAELGTSWLLLDAELLPWNVKAGSLLRDQYAAVGAAALASLPAAASALEQAASRGLPEAQGVGVLLGLHGVMIVDRGTPP